VRIHWPIRSAPSVRTTTPRTPCPMITSLGRTASSFSPCRAEWCRRALSTSAYAETPSASPMPPRLNKKTRILNNRVVTKSGPPRIFVRPWDGVPSMPDGFAMLRGIENKCGKIKAFKFLRVSLLHLRSLDSDGLNCSPVSPFFIVQDGELPSTYFSYFWVELEDPSRYSDAASTALQIPIPEVERKRPGGVGIVDLQPFLQPSPGAQEELQEWRGVTERMVDEVDERKRKNKVYDLRLEPSGKFLFKRYLYMSSRKKTRPQNPTRVGSNCSTNASPSTSPERS